MTARAVSAIKPRAELSARLVALCGQMLDRIVLDPETFIEGVEVEVLETSRFDHSDLRDCYLVRIHTNDASLVYGAVEAFKGSYKERLEGALEAEARRWDPLAEAAIDVVGPSGSSVEKLVPVDELIASGRLAPSSPIVMTARDLGLPHILIRGRHLIGPSPAVVEVLAKLLASSDRPRRAMELFAGTGAATKLVAERAGVTSVTTVESDAPKVAHLRRLMPKNVQVVEADAFAFPFPQDLDLVVADPYYESALDFLRLRGHDLRRATRTLVFIGGQVEHQSWNRKLDEALRASGFATTSSTPFGQRVFVCS